MIKDEVLAKYVNIAMSDEKDKPFDLYQIMADKVIEVINKLPSETRKVFQDLKINRKLVKTGIMTIPYGATVIGIADQIKDQFFTTHYRKPVNTKGDKDLNKYNLLRTNEFNNTEFELFLTDKDIYKLADIIYKVLYESHPTLTLFVKYLKSMNKLLKLLDLNNVWLSPSGIIVEQRYVNMDKTIKTFSFLGKRRSITIRKPNKNQINLMKQDAAIMPNLTHTLDAANIALVVVDSLILLDKVKSESGTQLDLITIHDCFGCHANHSKILVNQVKSAFIKLYADEDFVDKYHSFILEYIQKAGYVLDENKTNVLSSHVIPIPEKPLFKGGLNIPKNILGSKYFIN